MRAPSSHGRGGIAVAVALALTLSGVPVGRGPAPADAVASVGFFADSQPGDPLGGGIATYHPELEISAWILDKQGRPVGIEAHTWDAGEYGWNLSFQAPLGQALTAGTTYTNVAAAPTATQAAMAVSHLGTSCTLGDARFVVRDIEPSPPEVFGVDFRYRCKDSAGALFGSFRDGSTSSLRALLGPTGTVSTGSVAVSDGSSTKPVTLTARGTNTVTVASLSLSGPAAGDYRITSETCTGAPMTPGATCTVTLAFDPSLGGARLATLNVDDNTYRGARSFAISGTGTVPTSHVAWTASAAAAPPYTWNQGSALARSVTSGGVGYLHVAAATDRVGGAWVDDDGPYAGIVYTRRAESGTTWSAATRLNPTNQHGYAPAIAASGAFVYATWVRVTKWVAWSPTAPRTIYFRRNGSHGSGTWSAPVALTSTSGRVDFPTVAAGGQMVYVAYTDAVTGSIKVAVSADRGSTWRLTTIGTTTYHTADGYEGDPSVAAAGDLVIVSWTKGADNAVRARVSLDRATSWKTATTLATSSSDYSTAAARGSRLAVGWATASGAAVRVWAGGTWSPVRQVGPAYGSGASYLRHETATVALGGSGQIGIAWSACWDGCSEYGPSTRYDLLWAESGDNGANWFRTQVLGQADASAARRVNDSASVIWPTPTTRHLVYNGWTPDTASYRLYVRTGSGTP